MDINAIVLRMNEFQPDAIFPVFDVLPDIPGVEQLQEIQSIRSDIT